MNRSSRILQLILGFLLGVAMVVGALGAFGYFLWTRFTIMPSKPIFAEEIKSKKPPRKVVKKPKPSPSPSLSPSPSPTPEELPKGAYKSRVIWSEGLSLRSGPSRGNERVGGVGYNEEVIVLEEDGEWVKIRSGQGGAEGWVKSANLSGKESR